MYIILIGIVSITLRVHDLILCVLDNTHTIIMIMIILLCQLALQVQWVSVWLLTEYCIVGFFRYVNSANYIEVDHL